MSKKIANQLFENVFPIVPKGKVLSHKGNMVKKRQLKEDEVLVNYMIVPSNPSKRHGTAILNKGYLLTPKRKIIEATVPVLRHFRSHYVVENGIAKRRRLNPIKEEAEEHFYFNPKLFQEWEETPLFGVSKKSNCSRFKYSGIEDLHDKIRELHHKQKNQYRFDIWFGYSLYDLETESEMHYLPGNNTSFYYNSERGLPLINLSVEHVLQDLTPESIIERTSRPNSKYTVRQVNEYALLTTPLPDILIGAQIHLPEYIKDSKSIVAFDSVENNLCFWYCLSQHLNPTKKYNRLKIPTKRIFEQFYVGLKIIGNYDGVKLEELDLIEDTFKVRINVYSLKGKDTPTEMVRHSRTTYDSILNLNLYQTETANHFSLITKIHNITKVFKCQQCDSFIGQFKNLKRHYSTCNQGKQTLVFKSGDYCPTKNIFEQLDEFGIKVPEVLRFYRYFIFYDFEAYERKLEVNNEAKLQYLGIHELLSISLIGSEEEHPIFIPVNTTAQEALDRMIKTHMSEK